MRRGFVLTVAALIFSAMRVSEFGISLNGFSLSLLPPCVCLQSLSLALSFSIHFSLSLSIRSPIHYLSLSLTSQFPSLTFSLFLHTPFSFPSPSCSFFLSLFLSLVPFSSRTLFFPSPFLSLSHSLLFSLLSHFLFFLFSWSPIPISTSLTHSHSLLLLSVSNAPIPSSLNPIPFSLSLASSSRSFDSFSLYSPFPFFSTHLFLSISPVIYFPLKFPFFPIKFFQLLISWKCFVPSSEIRGQPFSLSFHVPQKGRRKLLLHYIYVLYPL